MDMTATEYYSTWILPPRDVPATEHHSTWILPPMDVTMMTMVVCFHSVMNIKLFNKIQTFEQISRVVLELEQQLR